jgi:hypothetical protein
MVLDPLSALSLAGNILQVVDFSTKIICQATYLYRSSNDALDGDDELDLVISDLSRFCDLVEYPTTATPGEYVAGNTANDVALQSLCKSCRKVV